MKTPANFTVGGKKKILSPDEAAALNEKRGSCPNCHQDVRLHRKGRNGQAAHFEHLHHDKCCKLADQGYGD